MTETVIDLIRHGEPAGGRRYRGHNIDDPLTEKGWSQMWNAVGEYAAWQQIITSPLQRCQRFAHELGERHGINVIVEPRFKEVGFGAWEGLGHDEVKIDRTDEYHAFLKDPVNQRPHDAEPLDDFIQRVGLAYEETLERYRGACGYCKNSACLSVRSVSNQNQQWRNHADSPCRNRWRAGIAEWEIV